MGLNNFETFKDILIKILILVRFKYLEKITQEIKEKPLTVRRISKKALKIPHQKTSYILNPNLSVLRDQM